MDNKLKKLFDFQRFQRNDHMEKLISETESRYGGASNGLSDEELDFVNAAGEISPLKKKNFMMKKEDKG